MKYIVKVLEQVGYNEYKSVTIKAFNDLEQANDFKAEYEAETGMNCYIEFKE